MTVKVKKCERLNRITAVRLAPRGSLRPLIWPDIHKSHSVLFSLVLVVPGGSMSRHYILLTPVNLQLTRMNYILTRFWLHSNYILTTSWLQDKKRQTRQKRLRGQKRQKHHLTWLNWIELNLFVLQRMYKGTLWHAYIGLRGKLWMSVQLYHPNPFPKR